MGAILLTRPQQDSAILAQWLAEEGRESCICPLTRIEPVAHSLPPEPFDGVLITSRHALLAAEGRREPCYVVGRRTADLARAQGLLVEEEAQTASELLGHLQPNAGYLYLSGAHIRDDFSQSGATITRIVTYQAIAECKLPSQVVHGLKNGSIDSVAFYSPRSAEIFLQLASQEAIDFSALTAY